MTDLSASSSPVIFPKQPLWDNGYEEMAKRDELDKHLGWHCLKGLKARLFEEIIIDLGTGRRVLQGWMVMSLAWQLAEHWRKTISDKRVGIVLPPGAGAMLANLSLLWAGKVPVNLNFTTSRESLLSTLRQTNIRKIVTAEAMKSKFPDFPWTDECLDIATILKGIPKWKILLYGVRMMVTPASCLWDQLDLPLLGGNHEAALLFSSGSCGEPKGVVLSHRNIVSNCVQIRDLALLEGNHRLLGCLPTFHSFGFTVTLWFPLMFSVKVISLPSPLEIARIVRAIEEEQATVLLGTPTFLRPYLKKATRPQLASLRFVIAGAEKVPHDLFERFREVLGKEILEGYGMTETSPVVGVNLPEEEPFHSIYGSGRCRREGSVGQLFPGMQAAILNPESGEPLGFNETGMLYLRGPNVFKQYYGDYAQTEEVLQGGWLRTGDLARIDEDGFLYIEGRLSRFSKIGGEMVPHGVIEEALVEHLGFGENEERALAVMGIAHPTKGENLVILSSVDLQLDKVKEVLQVAGFPNLWIPREWIKTERIPVLLAGKLDLKNCQKLVEQAVAKAEVIRQ